MLLVCAAHLDTYAFHYRKVMFYTTMLKGGLKCPLAQQYKHGTCCMLHSFEHNSSYDSNQVRAENNQVLLDTPGSQPATAPVQHHLTAPVIAIVPVTATLLTLNVLLRPCKNQRAPQLSSNHQQSNHSPESWWIRLIPAGTSKIKREQLADIIAPAHGRRKASAQDVSLLATRCYPFLIYMAIRTSNLRTRDQIADARLIIRKAPRYGGEAGRIMTGRSTSKPLQTLSPILEVVQFSFRAAGDYHTGLWHQPRCHPLHTL